jgi:hypothetical protein
MQRDPLWLLAPCLIVMAAASPANAAGNPSLPQKAQDGIRKMHEGDPEGAIAIFRELQTTSPDDPLGYLMEAEARWWKIDCSSLEVKWGMVDAWRHPHDATVDAYLALANKTIALAQSRNAQHESAEMHLYAGLGSGLKARLYAILGDHRAVARAGVDARAEMLRALQLDPRMTDADTGIGLYNYYVDVLPGIVKVLRFFMGLPSGNKLEGIHQLETSIAGGGVTAVEARFYLARNLRTYDRQYERAAGFVEPLVQQYPRNPIFLLLLANLNLELSRNEKASALLRRILDQPSEDATCSAHAAQIARSLLAPSH